jgi:hypothetical protein
MNRKKVGFQKESNQAITNMKGYEKAVKRMKDGTQ